MNRNDERGSPEDIGWMLSPFGEWCVVELADKSPVVAFLTMSDHGFLRLQDLEMGVVFVPVGQIIAIHPTEGVKYAERIAKRYKSAVYPDGDGHHVKQEIREICYLLDNEPDPTN